ncbi:hypothetical protein U9M48_034101 [Paspalum notatum var. saurae]|uniref:Protein kinase domain-containing protein n=1 Tax=Paspalum notatum var. saurae TaxID=547442 RepID=A0AAQ3U904_PASNO
MAVRATIVGAVALQLLVAAAAAPPVALPGCRESCGEVSVPYPFGIGEGCFHEGFDLTCDETQDPPRPFFSDGVEVLGLSLPDGTVRINSKILLTNSTETNGTWSLPQPQATGPFVVSSVYNWFMAVGCNIMAQIITPGSEGKTSTCVAMCVDNINWYDNANSTCSGIGLCRASIVDLAPWYSVKVTELVLQNYTPTTLWSENTAVFIVEKAWFKIYGADMPPSLYEYDTTAFWQGSVPAVLEWWSSDVEQGYSQIRCLSDNSFSYPTYGNKNQSRCNCSQGYEGNPYFRGGCQDSQIVEEGGAEDAKVVARLAEACLKLKGEERPTMRQAETTLEEVQGLKVHPKSQIERTSQNAPSDESYNENRGDEGTRLYSLEKEFIQSSEFPSQRNLLCIRQQQPTNFVALMQQVSGQLQNSQFTSQASHHVTFFYRSTEAMDCAVAFCLFIVAAGTTVAAAAAPPVALPGCPETCGNITVPYPFGTRPGCFRDGFNLTCDETPGRPPRLFVGDGVEVVDISLPDGTVRIHSKMLGVSNSSSSLRFNGTWSTGAMLTGNLAVSTRLNRFVAMGCNLLASLVVVPADGMGGDGSSYVSVCATLCADPDGSELSDTSCSGVGCCQTPIAQGLPSYGVQLSGLADQQSSGSGSSSSGFGALFIAEQEWFMRQGIYLQLDYFRGEQQSIIDATVIPAVLEWSLDKSGGICISLNSVIVEDGVDGSNIGWARCNCSKGFEGNPYIADGCQDINECQQPSLYPCHGTCINLPGTYRCSSKKSIDSLPGLITIIAVSAGFGLLFSILGVANITNKLKRQKAKKLRKKFFKRNHGLLLQQLIISNKDIAERLKIFSLEELEQATNNFDQNRILGGGGHGTVYKGILSDQRVVAIKKSKIVVQKEIDQFINEVVILSQTNHRNVVKLFGCCLETEVPLLVYEFISNGTLSYHLHGQSETLLSWKDRLRISLETARAIAYLHSAASISVFHRDIKSANILLTDTLTAKLSDFGASRSISIDETAVLTAIQGTHGYLDPEYYYTSRLTEKSDVYSFGVILAELLTRVKPVFSSHSSQSVGLASYFVSLVTNNRLPDILDQQIVEEGGTDDAKVVATLAKACLSLKGEERPTMRQVEATLEDVQSSKVHHNLQPTTVSQNVLKDESYNRYKGSEGTRLYSLEKEFIQSSEIPR